MYMLKGSTPAIVKVTESSFFYSKCKLLKHFKETFVLETSRQAKPQTLVAISNSQHVCHI